MSVRDGQPPGEEQAVRCDFCARPAVAWDAAVNWCEEHQPVAAPESGRAHADVIRAHIAPEADYALDALVSDLAAAEQALRLAREEIRLREESQIPMIPRAAAKRLATAEAERDQAAQALTEIANSRADDIARRHPGVTQYEWARNHARAALAAVGGAHQPGDQPEIDWERPPESVFEDFRELHGADEERA